MSQIPLRELCEIKESLLLEEEVLPGRYVKVEDLIAYLNKAVDEIRTSEKWKKTMEFFASFYQYSMYNTILIKMQRPDATFVRGFKQWKALGRSVKSGERGIIILAPMLRLVTEKVTETRILTDEEGKPIIDPETGQPKTETVEKEVKKEVLTGFKPVYVFDIKQTTEKELPCIDEFIRVIQTSTMKEKYNYVIEALKFEGIPVIEAPMHETVHGAYSSDTKFIAINSLDPVDQKFKTLIHEYAHAMIDKNEIRKRIEKEEKRAVSKHEEECIVESVAFIIAYRLGLDTTGYSAGYVAYYQEDVDANVLRKDLSIIKELAEAIYSRIKSVIPMT